MEVGQPGPVGVHVGLTAGTTELEVVTNQHLYLVVRTVLAILQNTEILPVMVLIAALVWKKSVTVIN